MKKSTYTAKHGSPKTLVRGSEAKIRAGISLSAWRSTVDLLLKHRAMAGRQGFFGTMPSLGILMVFACLICTVGAISDGGTMVARPLRNLERKDVLHASALAGRANSFSACWREKILSANRWMRHCIAGDNGAKNVPNLLTNVLMHILCRPCEIRPVFHKISYAYIVQPPNGNLCFASSSAAAEMAAAALFAMHRLRDLAACRSFGLIFGALCS
jgi:hypothetical protein